MNFQDSVLRQFNFERSQTAIPGIKNLALIIRSALVGNGAFPQGMPGEGGSHVLVIRWVHDLDAFHAQPQAEQERVFGRTKLNSEELVADWVPANAPIARVQVIDGGSELEIYRRSVPYGTVAEHGLYFVAFSADRTCYDRFLARIFSTSEDGLHDRLTDFSRPVSGAFYIAPSLKTLRELEEAEG